LATGFLASDTINGNLDTFPKMKDLCDWSKGHLLYVEQLKVILFTVLLSVIGTAIIGFVLKFTIGLRPTAEQEEAGLDLSDHGEEGYIL
jgi:Amt family ammonium transporter